MSDTTEEQYRSGALVVGPETDVQEEIERARRGLPSLAKERAEQKVAEPVYDDHDKLPGRPVVPQPEARTMRPVPVRTHYFSKPDGMRFDLGKARREFEMWGYVTAHRIAAGDMNYNPPSMQGGPTGGGRRGSMSDVGDLLLIHAQVEAFLLALPEPLRRLAVHLYVRNFRQEGRIKYIFSDSESEWHHEDDTPPIVQWKGVERKDVCFWVGDWRGLESPQIDSYAAAMGYSRNSLLEQESRRVLKLYASRYEIFEEKRETLDKPTKVEDNGATSTEGAPQGR